VDALELIEMHPERVGEDRLDHIPMAHGDPDGARAVRGQDLGIEGADGGNRPRRHGAQALVGEVVAGREDRR